MRFWKCEFCVKWDSENVNFVKSEISKMWILWKVRLSKCEFLDKLRIFALVCSDAIDSTLEIGIKVSCITHENAAALEKFPSIWNLEKQHDFIKTCTRF